MHFVLELRFREAIKCRVFKPHVTFDVAGVDSDMTTTGQFFTDHFLIITCHIVPPFRGLPEGSRGPAAIVFCWGGLTARPAPPSEACSRPPLSCFCSVFRPIYRCPLPAVISLFPVYPMRCRGACRASTLCSPLVLSGCRDTQEGWGITFNELCGYYTTIIGIVKKNFTSFFT